MDLCLVSQWLKLSELKLVSDPVALLPVLDVHILNADVGAVGSSEGVVNLAQCPVFLLLEQACQLGHINVEFPV